MTNHNNEIEQLILLFSKLPGFGARSARRIVLYLLQDKDVRMNVLIKGLNNVVHKITKCQTCGNIDTKSPCYICNDIKRDESIIAVVETVAELWAMERSTVFKGRYHVLGSALSAAAGQTPADLRLPELLKRCQDEKVKEIILATNSTLEGQTTAYFITEYFKDSRIKISRLASGIPSGGELDYLDEGTLTAAINLRQLFE